ncbi:MAG: TonB family protein / TonB-dependent receptor [Myxococcales bacterium]|nr:TonB family protein / TonB-dependent receptor [Myxococcales bacterium]
MALTPLVALVLVLLPTLARAESVQSLDGGAAADGGADAEGDAAEAEVAPAFEQPRALTSTDVAFPATAPEITAPVIVTVKLLVDVSGVVQKVDLVTAAQPIFDEAVAVAARAFHFAPARYGGAPVPVEITFTHTFLPRPPPPAAAPTGPALTSILRGKLVELGTRAPVTGATVSAVVGERHYTADADERGRFQLALPTGAARVSVYAANHNPFVQAETLAPNQDLSVTYLVERDRYDPYEIVIVGEQRREEVSRITLRGPEIHEIPGTFGDPFRVIQTLPGVSSVVSLLPFAIVRGSSPSASGYLLDGTRVPMLFHLLAGPSVIHPEFIDELQFYPGGAPAPYGGYTGGIIDGRTRRARADEHLLDFDIANLQAGGYVREPLKPLGATLTVAARYGYPGLVLGLLTNRLSLSYWDYQVRLDGGNARNGWTVFMFGAGDELDTPAATATPGQANPPLQPALILGFQRLDLRYHLTQGRLEESFRAVLGYDHTVSQGTDFSVWNAEPQVALTWTQNERLRLVGGVQTSARDLHQGASAVGGANAFSALTSQLGTAMSGSSYLEAIWRPAPRVLIRPGVRADVFEDNTATKTDVDPRLTLRYKLFDRALPDLVAGSDDSAAWLKASVGVYHQPPRFVLPLPGLDLMPLKYGLMQSYQSSLGVELPLREKFSLSAEGFFNYLDPTIFDLAVNNQTVATPANRTLVPTAVVTPPMDIQQFIDNLTTPGKGRAYGLEFLLRRQSKTGVFGWISYTLSRSERLRDTGWVPYDFDRTHLLNVVAGLPLRRNWDLGVRLAYQSGKPTTTTTGYNAAYGTGYFRFDFRVDKRAVYRKWLLDFYVDVANAAVLPEEVQPGTVLRYVLPTVGFRARL